MEEIIKMSDSEKIITKEILKDIKELLGENTELLKNITYNIENITNNIENDINNTQRELNYCFILMIKSKLANSTRIAELLLENGADPNSDDGMCDPNILLTLKKECDSNNNDKKGTPALILAILTNKISIVELLLENGIDPNTKNLNGESAWSIAIQYGKLTIAELLLTDRLSNK
jgi:hypothetical protein